MSIIFSYYENPVLFVEQIQTSLDSSQSSSQSNQGSTSKHKNTSYLYKCKTCSKSIKAQLGVTSNLVSHLNTQRHETIKKEYDEWKLKKG
jgi:hypothetical protein